MASVNVTSVKVLNNPCGFVHPFQFEITFECVKELSADLEWKLTYVGSAESEEYDQELDSVLVGPVPLGVNRFLFETPGPNHHRIPKKDILGVTVCLISCLYKGQEFIRVGYYVNNTYTDPDAQLVLQDEAGVDIDESDGEEEDDDEGEAEAEAEADAEADAEAEADADAEAEVNTQSGATVGQASESVTPNNGAGASGEQDVDGDNDVDMDTAENTENQKENQNQDQEDDPVVGKVRKLETDEEGTQAKRVQRGNAMSDNEDSQGVPELPRDFTVDKIERQILDNKPRLTRFAIDWD